jgi:hypothetical protein
MKIRVVKTASKAQAVQVVRYQDNKRIVLQHIGSAHSEEELSNLMILAEDWIKDNTSQLSLELLEQFFGISHSRKTYYKIAPYCVDLKKTVEKKVADFAGLHYSFNFDILFYDVTTLYFETFEEDGLRKNGFSKDNKSQQLQILIALMVSKDGFPVAYEIFSGNTFDGNTIIPVIKEFIKRNSVKEFTVVADAAMISSENILQLTQNNINYIVGARLGNISAALLKTIDNTIVREDGKSIRIKTENGYLICGYSSVRYRKDKYDDNREVPRTL